MQAFLFSTVSVVLASAASAPARRIEDRERLRHRRDMGESMGPCPGRRDDVDILSERVQVADQALDRKAI
jgi:hypothetical protein